MTMVAPPPPLKNPQKQQQKLKKKKKKKKKKPNKTKQHTQKKQQQNKQKQKNQNKKKNQKKNQGHKGIEVTIDTVGFTSATVVRKAMKHALRKIILEGHANHIIKGYMRARNLQEHYPFFFLLDRRFQY